MAKRGADEQITKDDYSDHEQDPDEPGVREAPLAPVAGRKIRGLPKRGAYAPPNAAAVHIPSKPTFSFGQPAAASSSSAAASPFSLGASSAAPSSSAPPAPKPSPFSGFSFGKPAPPPPVAQPGQAGGDREEQGKRARSSSHTPPPPSTPSFGSAVTSFFNNAISRLSPTKESPPPAERHWSDRRRDSLSPASKRKLDDFVAEQAAEETTTPSPSMLTPPSKQEVEYHTVLLGLNMSLLSFITKTIEKNRFTDLAEILPGLIEQYEKYREAEADKIGWRPAGESAVAESSPAPAPSTSTSRPTLMGPPPLPPARQQASSQQAPSSAAPMVSRNASSSSSPSSSSSSSSSSATTTTTTTTPRPTVPKVPKIPKVYWGPRIARMFADVKNQEARVKMAEMNAAAKESALAHGMPFSASAMAFHRAEAAAAAEAEEASHAPPGWKAPAPATSSTSSASPPKAPEASPRRTVNQLVQDVVAGRMDTPEASTPATPSATPFASNVGASPSTPASNPTNKTGSLFSFAPSGPITPTTPNSKTFAPSANTQSVKSLTPSAPLGKFGPGGTQPQLAFGGATGSTTASGPGTPGFNFGDWAAGAKFSIGSGGPPQPQTSTTPAFTFGAKKETTPEAKKSPEPFKFGSPEAAKTAFTFESRTPAPVFSFGQPSTTPKPKYAPDPTGPITFSSSFGKNTGASTPAPDAPATPAAGNDAPAEGSTSQQGSRAVSPVTGSPIKNLADLTGEGEEGEKTVWYNRAKLFKLEGGSYKNVGIGSLKLKKEWHGERRRLLMRTDGSGHVLLNMAVTDRVDPVLEKANVKFMGYDLEGKPTAFLARVKDINAAAELVDAIKDELEAMKGDAAAPKK